jgi:hypothetical protein
MGALTEPAVNPITGKPIVDERRLEAAHKMFDIEQGHARPSFQFLSPILAQTSLPYVDPGNAPFYRSGNGNVATTIVRGTLVNPHSKKTELLGYPFGTKPRLILMYLCTEATRRGNRELYLGDSLADFQRRMGINSSTGGATGSLRPTKEQLMRFSASHLQLFCSIGDRHSMVNPVPPIHKFDYWLPTGIHEVSHWDGLITLHDDFFRCLMEGCMPLRAEAISALQNSPMALDIYSWLAFRLWRIKKSPMKPLPWAALQAQFGPNYGENTRQFRFDFKAKLALVKQVYPEASFGLNHCGELVLRRSKPPVPPKIVVSEVKMLKFPRI